MYFVVNVPSVDVPESMPASSTAAQGRKFNKFKMPLISLFDAGFDAVERG